MSGAGLRTVYVVAAKRTPFGTFLGKLKDVSATDLAAHATKAALASGNVPATAVDAVIVGNVAQSSSDAAYLARHAALKAGCRQESTALTLNRLCGSGFQSVISGTQEIELGRAKVVVAGGTESMTQVPYAVRGARKTTLGQDLKMEDTLWSSLTDAYANLPMALTAEKLAEQYGITRGQCDEFALQSQARWAAAHEAGHFAEELAPVEVKGKKGPEQFSADEHPRPESTLEKMASLKAVFKKGGTVTAANASGICDGAGAVVLASEEAVKQHGLTPLARMVSYGVSGVDPTVMGIGPVTAFQQALKQAKLSLTDMALCEVNEAFAAQYLSVAKELGLDNAITNSCGGAIALGHPLAASGSRITAHLVHQLRRTNQRYAIGGACIGGGQGIAVLLEKM
eukprot:scpid65575/ scgid18038/ 3-ketoacyl-CoA thiolase, mitochondrial; Acetyl-CoA acyltransferase; Beta-ketothiolase; Mitochondrial 3-oxoacyl-CoA thiolase